MVAVRIIWLPMSPAVPRWPVGRSDPARTVRAIHAADTFVDCLVVQHPLREIASARLCLDARHAPGRWRLGIVALADATMPLTEEDRALYDAIASRPVCPANLVGAVRRALAIDTAENAGSA